MIDHSNLLLLNKFCDDFESAITNSENTGSENTSDFNATHFLNHLEIPASSPPLAEDFIRRLTTELMAIELQRPPFPSEVHLREKYPQFDKEITAALRLTESGENDSTPESLDNATRKQTELRLPIEENFERSLIAERESIASGDTPSSVGKSFGRYRLIERLGAGGFGIVFRGFDPIMQRDVAIKLPRTSLMSEPAEQARFEREVAALARLNHPNIVSAYNAEQVDGYFSLVSEFLNGGNLEDWLTDRDAIPSVTQTVAIVLQLCDALEHAHNLGIVHCDIKPSNILIGNKGDEDPLIKLTDFGLARIITHGPHSTSAGIATGTLQYMSPEQLTRRDHVDATTDIYSVGIVLYRLLTGDHPFDSENEIELISQIVERQPAALQSARFKVPSNLAAIVSKCLMKRSMDRYQSVAELASDLKSFSEGQPVLAKPLGLAGQVSHWLRSKQRIREAGIYSLTLSAVLTIWSLLSMPIYYFAGLLEKLGIDRMSVYIVTVVILFFTINLPLLWAATSTIKFKSLGIWVGLIFSSYLSVMMVAHVFNIVQLDFGGVYKNESTRVIVFTLLGFLTTVQSVLYGIALYADRSQKHFRAKI